MSTEMKSIAIVGAGLAAITCARTLVQAGHSVTIFEKARGVGGRMSTRNSPFGTFDHGAQYFTVRDLRFVEALQTTPKTCRPWSANMVQVLDERGRVAAAGLPAREPHWVAKPGMNALAKTWAAPLADSILFETRVTHVETDAMDKNLWQLRTVGADESSHVYAGFDAVLLAVPSTQALDLLATVPKSRRPSAATMTKLGKVTVDPCWTLMLAFPQAVQPGLTTLGPQWNAARSTHHRIAWLTRESSKPGRGTIERWTVQASAAWSKEHLTDSKDRVEGKLIKAFSEVTGIRAVPSHVESHRWLYAKTGTPLGQSHIWNAKTGLGLCGDWCLGHRVENAFVSGLELALAVA
jgi:predicted NAD/FAD-dependent oxidoreductase